MVVNEHTTKPIYIDIYFNETHLGCATGFEVQKNNCKYLITNWHVVSGRSFIDKTCVSNTGAIPNHLKIRYRKSEDTDSDELVCVEKNINLYDDNENKLWYEHPTFGSDVDVVALKIEENPSIMSYKECFNYESSYSLNVTEQVFVLGFPFGYILKEKENPYAVWTSGTVATDPVLNININNKEVPAFLIDSKTRQGQSGSPVIYYSQIGWDAHYEDGFANWGSPFMKEIGIYSGRINKDSDLGYVWKWSVIKEIIDNINS